MALESSVIRRPIFISGRKFSSLGQRSRNFMCPLNSSSKGNRFPSRVASNCINPSIFSGVCGLRLRRPSIFDARARLGVFSEEESSLGGDEDQGSGVDLENLRTLLKRGVVLGAMVSAVLVFGCKRAFAMEEVANAGYGLMEQCSIMLKNAWPKMTMVLKIFKEQGAILTVLLSLSAFFSMAETSITTLWPWKFRMLCSDVTRFLTTILIGTTYCSLLSSRRFNRKKEGKLDSTVSLSRPCTSKVLVLDGATASVDTATDNLIKITLRLIEEYDSPSRLLENKFSSFSQLVG